jgi:hypothetical protein
MTPTMHPHGFTMPVTATLEAGRHIARAGQKVENGVISQCRQPTAIRVAVMFAHAWPRKINCMKYRRHAFALSIVR